MKISQEKQVELGVEAHKASSAGSITGYSEGSSPYVSPRQLSERWHCSRSTVDRVAEREGFTKLCLGSGKNGIVRYLREEVDAYEASRMIRV